MAAPRPSKFVQLRLPSGDLPSPPRIVLPGIEEDEEDWALPPRASRQADIPTFRRPEQASAFPFPPANEIPPGAYGQLRAQQGIALQPRDLLRVSGSIPRWDYGRIADEERLGPLQYEWEEEEEGVEPWPDIAPFQGPAEGSLAGWIAMYGKRMGEILDPVPPQSQAGEAGSPLPDFFDPIFVEPFVEIQHIPLLIEAFKPVDPLAPLTLPTVIPRPRRFYRVQHSAAVDQHGNETLPPSRTRDSTVLGFSAENIFPPPFERRINRANLERALDPMNVQPTSLVALYSNYGAAMFDFEMHHQVECADVYIAHIAAETFRYGIIPVMVTLPGLNEAQEVHLPALGLEEPRVLLFSVLSCLEILGIETEMTVDGVWFAIDSVPAQFIERREARGVPLDWARRDAWWARPGAGQPWEEWGEEGMARFGVDGVEVVDDRPPLDEDMPSPDYPHALPIPVDEEERNRSRSPSSFVDDETPDNVRTASMLEGETPDTTRSPDVPRAVQASAGPSAAASARASAARVTESSEENENVEDGGENEEKESTWKTELTDLINEELDTVMGGAGDAADALRSPSLRYALRGHGGLFIYDSQWMW
ncbi:hypothetical protein VC83_00427 [Pseudogymnoascus destructans]|uniref:Uncharacterized protein n=2 Tax=Pseudogymnoascus destructans TaxID=655981 RepID=L8G6P6_PSED2|nr:uncharacterized protein VC83_00427 [Pseudogymnoascus destructans]ELR08519.1 hypothetical protein GMDG_03218 [Pseudogymnoascus destructans 20631-21]OAF63484.2 hypothetical protein VC83_00427 [Pseudogymnoascus destructans]